jgi:nicotinic acid mononucleotide adenylyltransferase
MSLTEGMKAKLICDLRRVHSVGKILLVGKDKQKGITKFILVQHALKLVTIVGVNNENDTLSILEICKRYKKSMSSLSEEINMRDHKC